MAEGALLTRKIPLKTIPLSTDELLQKLNSIVQIRSASVHNNQLKVRYDARFYQFSQFMTQLSQLNVEVSQNRWNKWRYRHYESCDKQARENSKIKPYCCDKVAIRRENL